MKPFENQLTREQHNKISGSIINAAIAVHRELGPGLLESAYEACLVSDSSFLCVLCVSAFNLSFS
jgi:hypothetical protein